MKRHDIIKELDMLTLLANENPAKLLQSLRDEKQDDLVSSIKFFAREASTDRLLEAFKEIEEEVFLWKSTTITYKDLKVGYVVKDATFPANNRPHNNAYRIEKLEYLLGSEYILGSYERLRPDGVTERDVFIRRVESEDRFEVQQVETKKQLTNNETKEWIGE